MRDYTVSAEFYDLLQATEFLGTARRLLDRWLGIPTVGVLDVGAGTGLVTGLLARRCTVTIHAIEPAASMRTVMLSRLAGHPELLAHVRVHAMPIEKFALARVADLAICLNTMSSLPADARTGALAALARAVVKGGTLIVQRPPNEIDRDRYDLPTWLLGGDTYGGEVTSTETGDDEIEWCFTYRVSRDGATVREMTETFPGYLASAPTFDDELVAAGFEPRHTDTPDIVIALRAT